VVSIMKKIEKSCCHIRKARISDVREIQRLINHFAGEGHMLPRSLSELYDDIRDFHVCEYDSTLVGVCALHVVWEDLAELKSLAVVAEAQRRGIGSTLARACLQEAVSLKIERVFTLTDSPDFFRKVGFKAAPKEILPQKVWGECVKCARFPDCNEVALIYEVPGKGS